MQAEPRAFRSPLFFKIVVTLCLLSQPAVAQIHSTMPTEKSEQKVAEVPGQITGFVYRADTNEPLFDAVVVLIPQRQAMYGRFPETRSAADGSFNFPAVATGDYTVEANAEGFLGGSYSKRESAGPRPIVVTVHGGQRVEGVILRLDLAGSISGTVYDTNGEPAHNVMVLAIQPRFEPNGREDVFGGDGRTVDDDGEFHIARLRPGSYVLRFGGPPAVGVGEDFSYRETYYPGTDLLENAETVQVISGQDTGGISKWALTQGQTEPPLNALLRAKGCPSLP